MDCWLSESFSSLLLNELAEKPAISGRARESAAGRERGAEGAGGGWQVRTKIDEIISTLSYLIRRYLIETRGMARMDTDLACAMRSTRTAVTELSLKLPTPISTRDSSRDGSRDSTLLFTRPQSGSTLEGQQCGRKSGSAKQVSSVGCLAQKLHVRSRCIQ